MNIAFVIVKIIRVTSEIIGYLVVLFAFCNGVNWFVNRIKSWFAPLRIKMDYKHTKIAECSGVLNMDSGLLVKIPIDFYNRSSAGYTVSILDYTFEYEIKDVKNLKIQQIAKETYSDFSLASAHSIREFFPSTFLSNQEIEKRDVPNFFSKICKKTKVKIKIKFVLSLDSKEREYTEELTDFFKYLSKIFEEEFIKMKS